MMKLLILTCVAIVSLSSAAFALDWTVNSTRDVLDDSPGDRICSTGFTVASGEAECTLRAALQEVNARRGIVEFDSVYVPAGVYHLTIRTVERDEEDRRQLFLEWSAVDAVVTGDLDVDAHVAIIGEGEGRTVISGALRDRVFDVVGGLVSLQDLTLEQGRISAGFGGCLQNHANPLQLTRVTIQDCRAEGRIGGGMYNHGVVWMERVTFRRNRATRGGGLENGGVARINESTFDGNTASLAVFGEGGGGGISNLTIHGAAPQLELSNTTLSNNIAYYGGGLLNQGLASMNNVTVAGNDAARGGGIVFDDAITPAARGTEVLVVRYSTIARNTAGVHAGISQSTSRPLTFSHVVLGGNRVGDTAGFNCNVAVTSSDHSLEDTDSCGLTGVGDMSNTPARLRALADNGGPTQTVALRDDSPAIDAGVERPLSSRDARDQRGVPRPLGSATDIGAFEFGIDPRTLLFIIPVRFLELFPYETPGTVISYAIDLSLGGAPPKKDSDGAAIMSIKAGEFQGQLQFDLDKSGRKVTVKGTAMAPKPSDNPADDAHKDGPVLFYVEVLRSIRGAAVLRVDELSCECNTRPGKPAAFVIPPFKSAHK
jgi:hypothetical protein